MNFLISLFKVIFPISRSERNKFLLMALVMFNILYISGSLRSIKDSIIVPTIGSAYLSFIDLYLVLPSSLIFTILYTKLTNLVERIKIFYSVLIIYGVFFSFFGYIIYPEYFNNFVQVDYKPAVTWDYLLVLFENWPITAFAIAVELWSPIILVLSFWQFANENIDTEQAKRFYPSFGLISNFALILSGLTIRKLSGKINYMHFIQLNMGLITFFIVLILFSLYFTNKYVNRKNKHIMADKESPAKLKLTVWQSFKVIINSNYLLYIFLMIISYGIINNILELRLKEVASELYKDQNSYAAFMGILTSANGVTTILLMIFGGYMLRNHGWRKTAIIPPVICLFSVIIFFTIYLVKNNINEEYYSTMLNANVFIGLIAMIFLKSSKYSLFDNTKEISYIPLPTELKTKGKAAIDLIGTRISDSGGAFIQASLLIMLGTATSNLYLLILTISCIIICTIWLKSVQSLSKLYYKQIKNNEIHQQHHNNS